MKHLAAFLVLALLAVPCSAGSGYTLQAAAKAAHSETRGITIHRDYAAGFYVAAVTVVADGDARVADLDLEHRAKAYVRAIEELGFIDLALVDVTFLPPCNQSGRKRPPADCWTIEKKNGRLYRYVADGYGVKSTAGSFYGRVIWYRRHEWDPEEEPGKQAHGLRNWKSAAWTWTRGDRAVKSVR